VSRIATIVVLVVVIAFSYFAFYNHGTIILTVWQGKTLELPVVGLVLFSMGIGAAIVFALLAIRGVRRSFDNFQVSLKKRRRAISAALLQVGYSIPCPGGVPEGAGAS
jgi:uncharacterized membrane-anchored protein